MDNETRTLGLARIVWDQLHNLSGVGAEAPYPCSLTPVTEREIAQAAAQWRKEHRHALTITQKNICRYCINRCEEELARRQNNRAPELETVPDGWIYLARTRCDTRIVSQQPYPSKASATAAFDRLSESLPDLKLRLVACYRGNLQEGRFDDAD